MRSELGSAGKEFFLVSCFAPSDLLSPDPVG